MNILLANTEVKGRPLRMQGRHLDPDNADGHCGKTPAHAGQTPEAGRFPEIGQEDPCACRADLPSLRRRCAGRERPLRMQGRQPILHINTMWRGKTPAHAGQTVSAARPSRRTEEDPCACRADSAGKDGPPKRRGRPLRMQGRPSNRSAVSWMPGKTPAHAGQTCC